MIREVKREEIPECANLIKKAFMTVANAVNLGAFSSVNPNSSATVINAFFMRFAHSGISSLFTSLIICLLLHYLKT